MEHKKLSIRWRRINGHSLTEAHHTVLTNSSLVAPYFEKHKNTLRPYVGAHCCLRKTAWPTTLHPKSGMEMGRYLSSVLTMSLTLSRLVFLNRGTGGD